MPHFHNDIITVDISRNPRLPCYRTYLRSWAKVLPGVWVLVSAKDITKETA